MRKLIWFVALSGVFMASTLGASCPTFRSSHGFLGNHHGGYYQYHHYYGEYSPFMVRTNKCVIREILDDGTLKVWDEADGEEHVVRLDDKTSLRARHKKDFDGRRDLDRHDLQIGQRIAVTALKRTGKVVGVKVIRGGQEGR